MPRKTRTIFKSASAHTVEHRNKAAPIIIEAEGDNLTFRHEGHRRRYVVSMADAFRLAIIHTP